MTTDLFNEFKEYAKKQFPKEAVAFVLRVDGNLTLFPLVNRFYDPETGFAIEPSDWLNKTVVCLLHSHPKTPPIASVPDRVMCDESGVPWIIYSVLTDSWSDTLTPSGKPVELIGRPFIWGVYDCFSMVRDYYKLRLNIAIPNFLRAPSFWARGEDLFRVYSERADFTQVFDGIKEHDVLAMAIHAPVPNHAAVVVQNNLILHHCVGQTSCNSVLGGLWLASIRRVYRHKTFL